MLQPSKYKTKIWKCKCSLSYRWPNTEHIKVLWNLFRTLASTYRSNSCYSTVQVLKYSFRCDYSLHFQPLLNFACISKLQFLNFRGILALKVLLLIPEAEGSEARVYWDCGSESRRRHWHLSLVSVVYCQKSLWRADPSSRGLLPTVVCLSEYH